MTSYGYVEILDRVIPIVEEDDPSPTDVEYAEAERLEAERQRTARLRECPAMERFGEE
jgi:hypothetical protein